MEIQTSAFLSAFSELKDPRVDYYNKRHELLDIVIITLCAVICRCETWEEIADYGEQKRDWLSTFLNLRNGIPSHDTFRRVFMLLNPQEFNECFLKWTQSISESFEGEVIAIDGKSVRGSADKGLGKQGVHMVSAWATERGIVLGQEKIGDKAGEITAIPEVIKTLDIRGSVVTIDAIGCQTEIATQIIEQKGDYILALKKNHKSFYQRVEEAFQKGFESDFAGMNLSYHKTEDNQHGRIEERNYFVLRDVDFLNRSKEWTGLSAVGLAESIVTRSGKTTIEKRYYILSQRSEAKVFGGAVRKHWQVENNLHWVLDVEFNDDGAKKRNRNSAANFSMIKRAALNLLNKEPTPWRNKKKRLRALLDDSFLEKILMGASV